MPTKSRSMSIGGQGEEIAAAFLKNKGYRILDRNYRFSREEIDIVAFLPSEQYEDGGELVFVEVKTRRNHDFGRPEEAVTESKQEAIFRTAEAYLQERKLIGSPSRFDVIAITMEGNEPHVVHFENAFGFFG